MNVDIRGMMTIEEIKKRSLPHFQAMGVRRAALFGSFARGEETDESDLDFLVDLPDSLNLLDVVHLKNLLEDEFNRGVDLIEFSCIKPRIRENVLHDQIVLL